MYIVGGNHDYYDSVMGYGGSIDKSVVYDRRVKDYSSRGPEYKEFVDNPVIQSCLKVLPYRKPFKYIMFCGKLYLVYIDVQYKDTVLGCSSIKSNLYDADSIISCLGMVKKKKEVTTDFLSTRFRFNVSGLKALYTTVGNVPENELCDIHHKYQSPIIMFSFNNVVFNPILKDYEFYKIVDPFTTYQEIDMFMSGVLSFEKDLIQISDSDRLIKHGFDNWSFRKKVR